MEELKPCKICNGEEWVCEFHNNVAWKDGGGCCGGAGMPCECSKEKYEPKTAFDWEDPFKPEHIGEDYTLLERLDISQTINARFREIIKEHGKKMYCYKGGWVDGGLAEGLRVFKSAILIAEKEIGK